MASPKRIIVTLSTGKQGNAAVRALAKRNSPSQQEFEILAVTRSASSSKAKALAQLPGVILLESEYHPEEIFEKASKLGRGGPIHGIFSVQIALGKEGVVGEERLAREVADVAAKNNVQHFVYTSVDRGDQDKTDVPHFESKRRIELYIKEKYPQMPLTILRPTGFMDNFINDASFTAKLGNTIFLKALEKPVQLVACSDIGEFAALSFTQPDQYIGQTVSIAGDELDASQIQQIYRQVKGSQLPTTFGFLGSAILMLSKELGTMTRFFNEHGFKIDISSLKKTHAGLKTWEEYVKTEM